MSSILAQQIRAWEMTLEQDERALRHAAPDREAEARRQVDCCKAVLKELRFYKSRNYQEA